MTPSTSRLHKSNSLPRFRSSQRGLNLRRRLEFSLRQPAIAVTIELLKPLLYCVLRLRFDAQQQRDYTGE